jgi:hypothetical protein
MRPTILALLAEFDEVEAAERASWTRIAACALLRQLPPSDRADSMRFLVEQHQRGLS